ncbi:hypothetical protein, partial [Klebsiella aerogenes]|uniref:hypothetical protein n=1 Tax=Klebsiella aerogenes TaxID=548 RepID=UPI001954A95C
DNMSSIALAMGSVKNGKTIVRALNKDREIKNLIGGTTKLHGRSLMLLRNVGHLMTNPAILE